MCGRYSLTTSLNKLQEKFSFNTSAELPVRYNIAPSQSVLTVISDENKRTGKLMKWGLVPSWSKDSKIGNRMINARAESVNEKISFKEPFKRRRCLILADGFYEWKKDNKAKQPIRFQLKEREPFAFAGLFDIWNKGEESIISCTIITTKANDLTKKVHDRMPVILTSDNYDNWLDPKINDKEYLKSLLLPYPSDHMEAYPVSSLVNSPKNDIPEVLEPMEGIQLSLF